MIFSRFKALRISLAALVCAAAVSQAAHFVPVDTLTGVTGNIAIQPANVTKLGLPIATNDEIGAFDTGGRCMGMVKWNVTGTASSANLHLFGQDPQSAAGTITGLFAGAVIHYRIWDAANSKEMPALQQGDSLFQPDMHGTLTSLTGTMVAPTLTSPANAAQGQAVAIALTWGTVTNAAKYAVQVSAASDFSSFVANDSTASATYSPSGLANATTYYWRVAGKANGANGIWSSVWNFGTIVGAPTLSSPANAATGQNTSVTLAWAATTGATSYTVLVSTASTFATTVNRQTGVAGTSASVSGLLNGTTYYWHASATNTAGTGAWSSTWNFSTVALPAAPTLSSPSNSASLAAPNRLMTVSWAAVTGATGYTVQVSSAATFASTVANVTATGTSSQVTVSGAGTFYWRVSTTSTAGTGAWSTAWTFTVTTPVLPGAAMKSITPVFSIKSGWIEYSIQAAGRVDFSFIDMRGRTALAVSKVQPAGSYRLSYAKTALTPGKYIVDMKSAGIEKKASLIISR